MIKKGIIFGILFSLILLVGCNTTKKSEGEQETEVTEVLESEQEVVVSQGNGGVSHFLSKLKNEIKESITEQTELESDSLAIMLDGNGDEITASVGIPEEERIDGKKERVDGTLVQQIVEDSVKSASRTKTNDGEKTKMKIEIEQHK